MTARFGRNKRRRAREAIAALEASKAELLAMRADDTMRLHNVTSRLIDAQEEIRQAKAIAGPASILFPAKSHRAPDLEPRPFYDVPQQSAIALGVLRPGAVHAQSYRFQVLRLPSLVAKVHRDWLDQHVHARWTFDGMPVAYSVSEESLCQLPKAELASFLMREVAPLMAQALADGLIARRDRR